MQELKNLLKLNNQLNYQILTSNIIKQTVKDKKHKEILLLLLQDRDRNFIRLNHNPQVYKRICKYLELFRPVKSDKKLVRIGGENDGGYVLQEPKNSKTGGGIVISLGVSDYSPFDLEMAELGFKVIQYDASIEKAPYKHKNIIWHKKFIGAKDEGEFISLNTVIKENKLNKNDILQCDIENFEWEMLENTDIAMLDEHFSQIIFEFHGLNPEENEGFSKRIKILEKLNEYFIPIHLHFNNHGKIFYSNGLFHSTTAELSYVRKKDLKNLDFVEEIDSSLDYPTFLANPEIPIKFLRKKC